MPKPEAFRKTQTLSCPPEPKLKPKSLNLESRSPNSGLSLNPKTLNPTPYIGLGVWGFLLQLLMDKILHDPKDPKLWELWYIPFYGSCRILSINRMSEVIMPTA